MISLNSVRPFCWFHTYYLITTRFRINNAKISCVIILLSNRTLSTRKRPVYKAFQKFLCPFTHPLCTFSGKWIGKTIFSSRPRPLHFFYLFLFKFLLILLQKFVKTDSTLDFFRHSFENIFCNIFEHSIVANGFPCSRSIQC